MIPTLLKKIFGSRNDRLIKRYMHTVRAINALEPRIACWERLGNNPDSAERRITDTR